VRRANSFVETARALGFGLAPFAGGILAAAGGMKLGPHGRGFCAQTVIRRTGDGSGPTAIAR
jgi:hypothetical protein